MTHEELLAKISEPQNWYEQSKVRQALRSVVELHKPTDNPYYHKINQVYCVNCENFDYPCPTIEAIEKQLK